MSHLPTSLRRGPLATLQVNMGNLCNQSCRHCHVGATPEGQDLMSRQVVDDVLAFLSRNKLKTLDITGGAAELNANFEHLVASARPLVEDLIVRSNLTVLLEEGKQHLPGFLKAHKVHLICSLPCYTQQNVDSQRGEGVFEKSIKALQMLNFLGYAAEPDLVLDLAYNPLGGYLPAPQAELERDYKKALRQRGIEFNRLLTITNAPIKRFQERLASSGEDRQYLVLLKDSFNPRTLDHLMCRSLLSVGFDGRLYDCDFNLALGLALHRSIAGLRPEDVEGREIATGEHCLACTAGSGSSCQGALAS